MKRLNVLSLRRLNEMELKKVQMRSLVGGNNCRCGSCSATTSSSSNMNANHASGYTITGDYDIICKCPPSSVYSIAAL